MDRCFGTSDAYSRHLRELGHEAVEVVANSEPLQLRWAQEQAFGRSALRGWRPGSRPPRPRGRRGTPPRGSPSTRSAAFDPEVVYLQDLWFFKRWISTRCAGAGRLVAGQIASGLPPEATS